MVTDSLRLEVLAVADRQAHRNDDELLELLEYEWQRAGLAVADRGAADYLRSVRNEILRIAIRERETVSVINAMIADDTLNWAAQHHLASHQYAFVIGLLAAWVTRAALQRSDEPGNCDHRDGKNGWTP